MDPAPVLAALFYHCPGSPFQKGLDMLDRISSHPCICELRTGHPDSLRVGQHDRINFILGAYNDIHGSKGGTNGCAVSSGVVPLVRSEVQVEDNGRTGLLGKLRSVQSGAPARVFAQIRTSELENARVSDGSCQYIVDFQGGIGAVISVEDQWKLIRGFDAQENETGVPARFPRAELDIHSFFLQKMDDEVTDEIFAEGS
jgi:hypothetical protein